MGQRLSSLNPFRKPSVDDFPGVLIPLGGAEGRHQQQQQQRSVEPEGTEATARARGDERASNGGDLEKAPGSLHASSSRNSGAASAAGALTLESLRAEIESDLADGGADTAYERKSRIINKAIQCIGMGRFQWRLFVLCGFGWMADNLWLQGIALTLPKLSVAFDVDSNTIRFTTLALFLGLCIGALVWGILSDVVGRRLAFNSTLGLAGVFGLVSVSPSNWIGVCGLFACVGLGVGGNMPVDGALFLEFLPATHSNLLTLLSAWWPVGQLIASLVAWAIIPNYPTDSGWKYFILAMGAFTFVMFCCRSFFFHVFESPKFLLSQGRQTEAVAVIHGLAYKNRTKTWLTEEILNIIGGHPDEFSGDRPQTTDIISRSLAKFGRQGIRPLFKGWRSAFSTLLIWFIWATVGMGFPLFNAFLPQYLQSTGGVENSINVTYRNYAFTSIAGLPGSLIAHYTVDLKYVGRKGTMAFSTLMTAIFIFLFTIASSSGFQLAMSCVEAFFQNIMYGVLYAYTPEVFPAPNRGTGTGFASFLNRAAGLCAPIVAIGSAHLDPKAPIYASAGLFFATFIAMLILPIETRGRQSL